jgi:hypothetical protein
MNFADLTLGKRSALERLEKAIVERNQHWFSIKIKEKRIRN